MLVVVLFISGLIFGSFINALVWRLHGQENSKKNTKSKNINEDISIIHGRSMCPHCRHMLVARDLVPVFSWLALKGKCRYCKRPISAQYPLVELVTGVLFVASYVFWPHELGGEGWVPFGVWLAILVYLIALSIYDLKWYLLPNKLIYQLYLLAFIFVVVSIFTDTGGVTITGSIFGFVLGGGIYYLLFQISGGKWIGGGDVKLGGALGLVVGGPLNALIMLFLSSLLGTLVALPLMAKGKAVRTTKLPYGPFLIVAAIIVLIFGNDITEWYKSFIYF